MRVKNYLYTCLIAIFVSTPVYAQQKRPAQPPKPLYQLRAGGHEMVAVIGGCYKMGSNFGAADEKPVHEVCVDDFYIGKYEVTQAQWQMLMGSNPAYFLKGDKYPVEQVSWNDVQVYINMLNRKSGKNFRLPTEAEWEYACRSGGKNEKYCGGNDKESFAWYESNSEGSTRPIGNKQPNGLGIHDMSGNVWEWTGDWFDMNYYARSPRNNPKGSDSGLERVFRGGAWNFKSSHIRSGSRFWLTPTDRHYFLGFRLALPLNQ